jgi:uncharacterized protein (TIGR03083 family)
MTATPSSRAGRLLLAEAGDLVPLLRATPEADLERPTLLPGWRVRDVLAHCSAALGMTVTGRFHGFSPEENARDVAERSGWSIDQLLTELESGYAGAAVAMDAAAGRLDGLALGEWVHGGDVRDALGRPDAYVSAGLDDALVLLAERSVARRVPVTAVLLTGPGEPRQLTLGASDGAPIDGQARLETDACTLIRLCAGRDPDQARYTLTGASPADHLLFS